MGTVGKTPISQPNTVRKEANAHPGEALLELSDLTWSDLNS